MDNKNLSGENMENVSGGRGKVEFRGIEPNGRGGNKAIFTLTEGRPNREEIGAMVDEIIKSNGGGNPNRITSSIEHIMFNSGSPQGKKIKEFSIDLD